jgi:hypothetical protein
MLAAAILEEDAQAFFDCHVTPGDMEEWPADLRVRDWPAGSAGR